MAEKKIAPVKKVAPKAAAKAAPKAVAKPSLKEATAEPKKLGKYERQVFDLSGKEVEVIKLPESVFGKVNQALLSQAIRVYQANTHQGTASTKTRGEVRGGGRKPYRQKGTGNARQGSIRAPHYRGGGIIFGPKPRDLSLELPAKMKRAALKSALASRLEDLMVVESFKLKEPKTKLVQTALNKLGLKGRTLFVLPEANGEVLRAGRNIKKLDVAQLQDLNAYQVVSAGKIVFAKDAVAKLEENHA